MKYAVLSFLIFLSSVSFSQERTSLIIQKNSEVSLASLLSPILDSKTGIETVYLSQLYLGEGAKLYINRPVTIDAKKIILKSKSTLHTLGNSLTIKTEIFEALNFELSNLNLSEDQRKELMGRIDTRHKEEKHHGKDGESRDSIAGHGKNAVQREGAVFEDAQRGFQGEAGGDGQKGRKSGDLTLYVKRFMGGYFDTRGGDGGRGGKGGRGGNGGQGFSDGNYSRDYGDSIWRRGPSDYQYHFFCDGAEGGESGRGGNGGNGGKGGNVSIFYEEKNLSSERMLLILNEGGKGGEGGLGGEGGEGGAAGSVPIGNPSNRDGGKSGVRRQENHPMKNQVTFWFDGKKGTTGAIGVQGESGADGAQGARQIQKYDFQN